MNHLNISAILAMVLLVLSCKTEPQTETIDYKRTDNSVIARLENDVKNLIPYAASSNYESQVFEQLYLYLIGYEPINNQFTPELIKEIPTIEEVNEGPYAGKLAYTLEILEDANWADGSPVTAKDWVTTLKVIMNPQVTGALRYVSNIPEAFTGIEIDESNPKKFKAYFDGKTFDGLYKLTNSIPVLPSYILDPNNELDAYPLADLIDEQKADALAANDENFQAITERLNAPEFLTDVNNITGAGPYEVADWQPGQRIALQKKSDWWGDKVSKTSHPTLAAYPAEIVYKPITNPTTALAAMKSEEIDANYNIAPAEFDALKLDSVAGERYNLTGASSLICYFYSINTDAPKLSDKRVRRALAYALDVDEVLEKVYNGYGERVTGPVLPSQPYINKDLEVIRQNIDKAKSLLSEAGWKDSNNNGIVDKEIEGELVELSIELLMSQRETTRNAALLFQGHAKQAGIDIQMKPVTGSALFAGWRSKDYDLASVGTTITPNWNPNQSWHTEGDNRTGFGNAESDALIEKIPVTLNDEERNAMYRELQSMIYDDQPAIYLWAPVTPVAVHNRFEFEPFNVSPCYQPRYFKLKEEFLQ